MLYHLGPCWLNIKEPKNMETLPLARLHDDLQNDPSMIWKTSAFTQNLRSKFWAVTLLSLPRTSSPHPSEENGGHTSGNRREHREWPPGCGPPALPPPLHTWPLSAVCKWLEEDGGEGDGEEGATADGTSGSPACPLTLTSSMNKQTAYLDLKTFYISNVIKNLRLAWICNVHIALQMPFSSDRLVPTLIWKKSIFIQR